MKDKEQVELIYRITSGYSFITTPRGNYILDTPTDRIMNESLRIYRETIEDNRFGDFLPNNKKELILFNNKQWRFEYNEHLKGLEKSLDNCKIELYELRDMPSKQVEKVRKQMELIRKNQSDKLRIKHSLDHLTLEGFAEYISELHLFSLVLLDRNYNKIDVDDIELEKIIRQYKLSLPSLTDIRQIARSPTWRNTWMANKNCFRIISDEQKVLVSLTKLYDNVYENTDRPDDKVIEDDDMLDGWMLVMAKKREEERREASKEVIERRHGQAGEIFIMAEDEADIKDIEQMNDARGNVIRKRIEQELKSKGYAKDLDILEFKTEAIQKAKGK